MATLEKQIFRASLNLTLGGPTAACLAQVGTLVNQVPSLQTLFAALQQSTGEQFSKNLIAFQTAAYCLNTQVGCPFYQNFSAKIQTLSGTQLLQQSAIFLAQITHAMDNYSSDSSGNDVLKALVVVTNGSGEALTKGYAKFLNTYIDSIKFPVLTEAQVKILIDQVEAMQSLSGAQLTLAMAKFQSNLSKYFSC